MDILSFFGEMAGNRLLFTAVFLTLGVILVNGWTDAPNAIATCVVTRCLPLNLAIFMAAIFNFLGVFLMTLLNATVAETITKIVDFGRDSRVAIIALCAALFGIILWATLAWIFGIPTSESHALIAGLTGSAVAINGGFSGINFSEWVKVIYGIFISVFLGFCLGFLMCRLVTRLFAFSNRIKTERFFTLAQIFGAGATSFMHGAQDGQKFMGVMMLCVYMARGNALPNNISIPLWLMLLCSIIMALGTAMGGKKIIKSVGMDMVCLQKYQGFSADLATAISLLFCSVFSLPVSTTHAKTTSIMGVGAAKSFSSINLFVVKEMALAWVFTFPGCSLIGYVMTKIFMTQYT